MKVTIKTIPHAHQAYPTVGNWGIEPDGNIWIEVSELGDWREEMLIALHELVEVLLCKHRGITTEQVDVFDKKFEKDRELGLHEMKDKPGDDPKAPYKREHFFATNIEALMSAELGVDWNDYEAKIESL